MHQLAASSGKEVGKNMNGNIVRLSQNKAKLPEGLLLVLEKNNIQKDIEQMLPLKSRQKTVRVPTVSKRTNVGKQPCIFYLFENKPNRKIAERAPARRRAA